MRPLLLLSLFAFPACSGCTGDTPTPPAGPAAPAATDRLLEVDGLTITFGDVQPWVDYLDTVYANHSLRTKMRRVLDEFVLPMALARRAFPDERQELLARARALHAVAGNVVELEAKSKLFEAARKNVGRRDVELPVSRFLFDPLAAGSVSEPIEVPHGYKLAAAHDLAESAIVGDDLCDALIVPFVTHSVRDFTLWYDAEKIRIAKATWIHPDYRDAAPEWLHLP